MNKSESITKISADLLKAQTEMGNATKDSRNPFYKSSFATLNSVREAIIPVLNKNNISIIQPMKILDGRTLIETVMLHSSGEWISSETPVVVAKLNDPQAEGSGQSYARRYSLMSMLNIAAEDDDSEAAMGRKSNTKPIPVKLEEHKVVEAKFDGTKQAEAITEGPENKPVAEAPKKAKPSFNKKKVDVKPEVKETEEW